MASTRDLVGWDTGISGGDYADSWVDAKGAGYLIAGNTGTFGGDGELSKPAARRATAGAPSRGC